MVIKVEKKISSNLFQDADWAMFSGRPDLKNRFTPIGVCSLTWTSFDEKADALRAGAISDLARRYGVVAEGLGSRLQIFAAHLTLQPRSATVLYRKIWKMFSMKKVPSSVELGVENRIECATGVRFVSLANVPMVAYPWMISIADEFDVVMPLLLPQPLDIQSSTSLELARIAFPPDGCCTRSYFDWAAVACHIASLGGFCVRSDKISYAGELSVDFFCSEEKISGLVRLLETDDELNVYRVH